VNHIIRKVASVLAILLSFLIAIPAFADTLQVSADAPWYAHFGASAILILHIAGGTIGIVTGYIASFSKKGAKVHRISGQTFFVAMFTSYLIAACVAPFIEVGARPNTLAGILALYLLLSGVSAARRRKFTASMQDRVGVVAAFLITGAGVLFAWLASQSEPDSANETLPEAFAVFIIAGGLALVGEIRVLIRGQLSNTERVKRHLWRMCASFFIASGSFFVGQPQVFPEWFNTTPLPSVLSFAPILIMIYFLVRYGRALRQPATASA